MSVQWRVLGGNNVIISPVDAPSERRVTWRTSLYEPSPTVSRTVKLERL